MGVREGGSYVAGDAGSVTLVERMKPHEPNLTAEASAAPEVMSAPAPEPAEGDAEAGARGRRRTGSATNPQE